ncbi:GTP-binding protein Rhes [Aethina tumida]|uniref:GTP-binding protein Rhes n=1 Tax=Aethina tumida TaxID=116153 RepID=UPI00096AFC95|nr:GTP-binding protein Rhes [Aethina tumida]
MISSCTNWLCTRKDGAAGEKMANHHPHGPLERKDVQPVVTSGPGPSPGSSNSCDDVIPPPKNCYRLVMLGSSRVGKTCLVSRFLGGKFQECYTPTIEDFHRKLYRIRGEIYQLDILDTSGNHPFPAMRRLSFLTGDLFVIVFSMDSRETFEEAIRLREQIIETKVNAGASSNSGGGLTRKKTLPRVPMILAGNKCDKEMKTVTPEEAQTYCDTQDSSCAFVETSAKKNLKVDEVFYQLFLVANLPQEMAPNHHKRISANFGAPCPLPPSAPSHHAKKYHLSVKRRLSDACGVVTPNVRRPSIRTDLMIMRTKTCSLGDGNVNSTGSNWRKIENNCVLQ